MEPKGPTGQDHASFDALMAIVERLRSPGGCPWDIEQTHESLKRNLLEECYEVLEAIDRQEPKKLAEEMGDILVQVAFHSDIAARAGEFDISDVLRAINEKLVRRHPHVFGDVEVADAREVERNWDLLKEKERGRRSPVEGIPSAMPSLSEAQLMQDRVSRVGFDWDDAAGVLEKVSEEIREVAEAESQDEKAEEIGDLLFSLVNLARWEGVHAEDALRRANEKFRRRYLVMERLAQDRGVEFGDLSMEEKERLWQEAKGMREA